jgi:predicted permease
MRTLIQELRRTLRGLRAHPGFAAVVVLTLALGIGANTAVFSVVHAVLLAPLPFREPYRLAMLTEVAASMNTSLVSPVTFADWGERKTVFEELGAFRFWDNAAMETPGREGVPEPVLQVTVTPNYFRVLGIAPTLGRTLSDDKTSDGAVEAVLSDELWRRRFAADTLIIGKRIRVRGASAIVVGVMPPVHAAVSIGWAEVWTPLRRYDLQQQRATSYRARYLNVVGRLKPGVTLTQARAAMTVLQHQLQQEATSVATGYEVQIASLDETLVGGVRPVLLIVLTGALVVLLTTCANVANLLLARGAAREREVAVRAALGATRGQLVRDLMTESWTLAALGAALGIGVARAGLWLLQYLRPDIPRFVASGAAGGLHMPALLFALGTATACALLVSLVPVLGFDHLEVSSVLKEAGRTGAVGVRRQRTRRVLVASQIAFACALLIAAGLLVQSLSRLLRVDPGFNASQALIIDLDVPADRYPGEARQRQFYRELLRRLDETRGIAASGALLYFPYHAKLWQGAAWAEGAAVVRGEEPIVYYNLFAGDYFRAMGIPLESGRLPTDREMWDEDLGVALINTTMARQLFGRADAVGRRFKTGENSKPHTVIGVVGDVRQRRLDDTPRAEYYVPYSSMPMPVMTVIARTAAENAQAGAATRAVRSVISGMDPGLPLSTLMPLHRYVAGTVTARRMAMSLLVVFGILALVLAGVGIYGVMSYAVSQRTAEIGIRTALGATPRDVVGLVTRESLTIALVGVVAGAGIALVGTRALSALLFDVSAHDLTTYVAAPTVLLIVAFTASLVPAIRATRISPVIALRKD